jgi:hypothetical protein
MTVTDTDQERVIRLLGQDLKATIGRGHEELVVENARRLREFVDEPAHYVERVVDDTQQDVHDSFIDTTWPKCPRHQRHPLWFRENGWWCEADRVRVAPLGELALSEGRQVLVRKVVTASGGALGIVLAVMAYALMHDFFDGLPFTRTTESWSFWAAGLLVGGLLLILMEAAGDWLFGPVEPWRRSPRRMARVAIAVLLLALVIVTVAVVSK